MVEKTLLLRNSFGVQRIWPTSNSFFAEPKSFFTFPNSKLTLFRNFLKWQYVISSSLCQVFHRCRSSSCFTWGSRRSMEQLSQEQLRCRKQGSLSKDRPLYSRRWRHVHTVLYMLHTSLFLPLCYTALCNCSATTNHCIHSYCVIFQRLPPSKSQCKQASQPSSHSRRWRMPPPNSHRDSRPNSLLLHPLPSLRSLPEPNKSRYITGHYHKVNIST